MFAERCVEPNCPNPVSRLGKRERRCAVHADKSTSATPVDIEAVYAANLAAIKARRQFTLDLERISPQSGLLQNDQGRAGRVTRNGESLGTNVRSRA